MHTCSAGTGLIVSPCPSPPACGGRGRGPARLRREGEVGSSAVRDGGLPHLTPTLSAPKGGEEDIPAACLAVRSMHALAAGRVRLVVDTNVSSSALPSRRTPTVPRCPLDRSA